MKHIVADMVSTKQPLKAKNKFLLIQPNNKVTAYLHNQPIIQYNLK